MATPFDPRSPNITRVYNTLVGGKDNYESDRGAASGIAGICPDVALIARENKQFAVRATGWMAQQGAAQFLDLGCGLPVAPSTHETAREAVPDAVVAYVDTDPVAVSHMSTFVRAGSGVAAVHADVCDLAVVCTGVADVIDFTQPVAVLMCALLHFYPPANGREIVRAYADLLAPGSYLAVSVIGSEGRAADRFVKAYRDSIAPVYAYSAAEVAGLVSGFELVPPGVAPPGVWRPGGAEAPAGPDRGLSGHAVIGHVL